MKYVYAFCMLLLGCTLIPACSSASPVFNGRSICVAGNGGHGTNPCVASTPIPTVAYVLPVMIYGSSDSGCSGGDNGLDAQSTADAYLFRYIEDACDGGSNSIVSSGWCSGPPFSSTNLCTPFLYRDFAFNTCAAGYQATLANYANTSNENAFWHVWPGTVSSSNRNIKAVTSSCASYGGDNSHEFEMNMGNSAMASYIYTNFLQPTAQLPAGWQLFSDDNNIASGVAGFESSGGVVVSTEYGEVNIWNVGSGGHPVASPWLKDYSVFPNAICGSRCVYEAINAGFGVGNSGTANACATNLGGGHCEGATTANFGASIYDNHFRLDAFCSNLSNPNVLALIAERQIGGNGSYPPTAENIALAINTAADLLNNHTSDNCRNTHLAYLDQPAQIAGMQNYLNAFRWMVPSASGSPDFITLWRYVYNFCNSSCSTHEVALEPQDTIVPYGPETVSAPLAPYVWNGTTINGGTGCDTTGTFAKADGDTGGIIPEVVDCPAVRLPVLLIQYAHCYYAQGGTQVDKGPCAALLNTSSSAVTIQSSWFGRNGADPYTTYHHLIDFNGTEWPGTTPLYYASGLSVNLPCTNTTYCNASVDFTGTLPTPGTSTIAAQTAIFFTAQ